MVVGSLGLRALWFPRGFRLFYFLGGRKVGETVGTSRQVDPTSHTAKRRHTVAKLIGSPPGYVGYDEESQLTDPAARSSRADKGVDKRWLGTKNEWSWYSIIIWYPIYSLIMC